MIRALLLLSCLQVFFPVLSWAGDLRVLDNLGLVRAYVNVTSPAQVLVVIRKSNASPQLHLSNVDGLSSDIVALRESPTHFRISAVPEGSWRIVADSDSIVVTEVKIVQ